MTDQEGALYDFSAFQLDTKRTLTIGDARTKFYLLNNQYDRFVEDLVRRAKIDIEEGQWIGKYFTPSTNILGTRATLEVLKQHLIDTSFDIAEITKILNGNELNFDAFYVPHYPIAPEPDLSGADHKIRIENLIDLARKAGIGEADIIKDTPRGWTNCIEAPLLAMIDITTRYRPVDISLGIARPKYGVLTFKAFPLISGTISATDSEPQPTKEAVVSLLYDIQNLLPEWAAAASQDRCMLTGQAGALCGDTRLSEVLSPKAADVKMNTFKSGMDDPQNAWERLLYPQRF